MVKVQNASQDEYSLVDVVGKEEPEQITEYYLSQTIEARMTLKFLIVYVKIWNTDILQKLLEV